MLWLKRILLLLSCIVVFVAGLVFLTANEQLVEFSFLAGSRTLSVGGVFILGLVTGVLLSLGASYPLILAYKFRLSRAHKAAMRCAEKSTDTQVS